MAQGSNGFGGRNRRIQGLTTGPNPPQSSRPESGGPQAISANGLKMLAMGFTGLVVVVLGAIVVVAANEPAKTEATGEQTSRKQLMTASELFNGERMPELVTFHLPIQGVSTERAELNRKLIARCSVPKNNAPRDPHFPNQPRYPLVKWETGEIIYRYRRAPALLTCLMSHERARFCDAGERRMLARALVQYEDAVQSRIRARENAHLRKQDMLDSGGGGLVGLMIAVDHAKKADGPSKEEETDQNWYGEVTANVRLLAEDGYLSAKDFGRANPGELAGQLVEPRTRACPQ